MADTDDTQMMTVGGGCAFKRRYKPDASAGPNPPQKKSNAPTNNAAGARTSYSSSSTSSYTTPGAAAAASSSYTGQRSAAAASSSSTNTSAPVSSTSSSSAGGAAVAASTVEDGPLVTLASINSNCKVFHFEAILTSKAPKDWNKGGGANLNMTFSDSTIPHQFKVVVFHNFDNPTKQFDDYNARLVVGKTYMVYHGQVKPTNTTFNKTNHPYEMNTAAHTRIELVTNASGYLYKKTVPLNELDKTKRDGHCLLGKVVKKGGLHETIEAKNGGAEYIKNHFFLGDLSMHQVKIELWGKECDDYIQGLEEGDSVFCYNFAIQAVSRFNSDCLTLGPVERAGTGFMFRPSHDKAKLEMCDPELVESMKALEALDVHMGASFTPVMPDLTTMTQSYGGKGAMIPKNCQIIDLLNDQTNAMFEVQSLKLLLDGEEMKSSNSTFYNQTLASELKKKVEERRYKFTAYVSEALTLSAEQPFVYTACTNVQGKFPCNRRVVPDEKNPDLFFCSYCKITMETCRYLYAVNLLLTDETGSVIAMFFDEYMMKMLQDAHNKFNTSSKSAVIPISAEDLLKLEVQNFPTDDEGTAINSSMGQYITNELIHKPYRFTLKSVPDVDVGLKFTAVAVECIDYGEELRQINNIANAMPVQ